MELVNYQLNLIDKERHERKYLIRDILTRSPLLALAVSFMAGILIEDKIAIASWIWIGAALMALAAAFGAIFVNSRNAFYVLVVCAMAGFVCGGAMRVKSYKAAYSNDIRLAVTGRTLASVEGVVTAKPVVNSAGGDEREYTGAMQSSTSFYLDLKRVKTREGFAEASGRVKMTAVGERGDLGPGDYVLVYCWLDTIKPPANPGQFDSMAYLARRNVYVAGAIESPGGIEILSHRKTNFLSSMRQSVSSYALAMLLGNDEGASGQSEQMLAALMLGVRSDIDQATIDAFTRTGLLHILALSGSHVAMLVAMVFLVAKAVGIGRRWRAVICAAFIILFTLAVPAYSPILRASMIGLFFCVSQMLSRRSNALNTISLAALCLVLASPLEFYEPSWQLSFGCVLGMIIFTGDIEYLLNRISGFRFLHKGLGRWGLRLLAAGLAAQFSAMPVLAYHFYNIQPLGVLWTVLTAPLVFAIMVTGFGAMVVTPLLPTVGHLLSNAALFFAWVFETSVRGIASFDHTQILTGKISLWVVLFYAAILLFMRFVYLRSRRVKFYATLCCVVIVVVAAGFGIHVNTSADGLELTVFSVGHGQSILARFGDGGNCLFDCGSLNRSDIGSRVVTPYLNRNAVTRLDRIVISHPDIDHTNGIASLGSKTRNAVVLRDLNIASAKLPHCEILWPPVDSNTPLSDNDSSVVILISYAGRSIMLCSDVEKYAQGQILSRNPGLKPDVLIMPHHGSSTTLDRRFIEELSPGCLVYSCSRSKLESVARFANIQSLFTPETGAIIIGVSPAGELKIKSKGKSFSCSHFP